MPREERGVLQAHPSGDEMFTTPSIQRTLDIATDELERELLAGITSGPATPMTSADWVRDSKASRNSTFAIG